MKPRRAVHLGPILLAVGLVWVAWTAQAGAEEKSYYSPIIMVDLQKGWLVISDSGRVFAVEASPEAKPHLEKLPPSGLIDVVVEIRKDAPPVLKSWKLASGDSSCKVFDGKACK